MIGLSIAISTLSLLVLLFLIYLFLICPRLHHPDTAARHADYMHRGYHTVNGLPENSMAAFLAAVEKGQGIETDVQLSQDGVPMLFHDYTLTRMCGVEKKLTDCTAEELKGYRLLDSNEQIPTLAELLAAVDGRVPLLIELKGETTDTSLCPRVAERLDAYRGVYCVESFNPMLLRWYRRNRKQVLRGQLVTNLIKDKKPSLLNLLLTHLLLNFLSRPDFIAYNGHYPSLPSIRLCRRLGADGVRWTVSTPDELEAVHKNGEQAIYENIELS
ncbi:MAG: glycerophosphodiester phosphodiesterase [Clostridia bacterium]|nr:glycerophosphodiester phosphodiesterase [Clostridia bacterium]